MIKEMPNTIAKLDGKIVEFDSVDYEVNKTGFPTPALDITLIIPCGRKIYDHGSRIEIKHNNLDT